MAVGVERDRDARMPQSVRDDLRMYATGERAWRASVPEVVQCIKGSLIRNPAV